MLPLEIFEDNQTDHVCKTRVVRQISCMWAKRDRFVILPARADSIADPGVAVEAPADVVPVAPPSKKARQYDLPPQQPVQPMSQLQSQLPTSSSSPSALDDSTLPEPEAKKYKKQEEDEEELDMDTSHPLQPTDPPVLPLSEHQPPVAADLEASRVKEPYTQ